MDKNIIGYFNRKQTPINVEDMSGISSPSIDSKSQITNKYLEYAAVTGTTLITGEPVGTILDPTYIELSAKYEQTGNLNFKITPTGGLEIPVDGTYSITFMFVFDMQDNTSGKTVPDIQAEYGNFALVPVVAQSLVEGGSKSFLFYDAVPFWSTVAARSFTVSGNLEKGNVLYMGADHRRDTIEFPVIGAIYITKIS